MPNSFIDFQEVKDTVSIEKAVELLDLDLKPRNDQLRGNCPVCNEGDRIFCVTPKKGKWYCFGCKTGGDVIAMAAHIRGEHPKDAAHFLMGTVPERDNKPIERREKRPEAEKGFKALEYLEADHEAVEALGIEPDVAQAIGCGYAKRGVMRGTVALPVRLSDGTLIAYIGLTEIAKLPPDWKL